MAPFWRVLASKLEPSWDQKPPKPDVKTNRKNNRFLEGLWIDFWWILGPCWLQLGRPKGVQNLAFGALGWSWGQLGPTWTNLGPTWGQLGSNLAQVEPSWGQFWGQIWPARATWANLGQFGPNLGPTSANLGPTWAQLKPKQGARVLRLMHKAWRLE